MADTMTVRLTPTPIHTAYAVVNAIPCLMGHSMHTMLSARNTIVTMSHVHTVNFSV